MLIRRVETAAKALYHAKNPWFRHPTSVQNPLLGAAAATKDDYWISAYREHGHAIAKGVPANEMMAEILEKPQALQRVSVVPYADSEHKLWAAGVLWVVMCHWPTALAGPFVTAKKSVFVLLLWRRHHASGRILRSLCLGTL